MEIRTNRYSTEKDFPIDGASYIGEPRSNTAMFVSKKVGQLIAALSDVQECLVFAENGVEFGKKLAYYAGMRKSRLSLRRQTGFFMELVG